MTTSLISNDMMHCIYCAGRRNDKSFSVEHIWPQALGGDFCAPVFRTQQVCRSCNSLSGQWVDREFLRNFFTSGERSKAAREYLNPDKFSIIPLVFMGRDLEIPLQEDEICERWSGPSGESVYHIHKHDDDRWLTMAGGDFFRRKKDPGRVYFYLTDKSPYWFCTGILSIVKFFEGIKPRCLTVFSDFDDRLPILQADQVPLSEIERREIAWINDRPKGPHNHELTINLGYADRFLAKIALGLGHNILGRSASFSPYANELRNMLWCKDFSKREDIRVRGTGPWGNDLLKPISNFISWPGLWSVFVSQYRRDFALVLGMPSGRTLSIVMSDDPSLWNSNLLAKHAQGVIYIIAPQRECSFGPISMDDLIAHKLGHSKHPELTILDNWRAQKNKLPPRERANDEGY